MGLAWTFVISGLLFWASSVDQQETEHLAQEAARSAFQRDVVYRQWNANRGGVYAPISAATPPNPHLKHLATRDITTTTGTRLTLINPAYMTRQVHELGRVRHGLYSHITSLKPIRPANRPDPWEREALLAFEQGSKEVSARLELNGEPVMRLMRPLMTGQACLKCHAKDGYKVGDVRGGISISLPLAPYTLAKNRHLRTTVTGYTILWLVGLIGLTLGSAHIRRRILAWEESQAALVYSEKILMEDQKLKAVGHLAGGAAHDFNNLLTVVLGCSQFAQQSLPPGHPALEDLVDIEKAGERAKELTRQLLAFSRRQVLEPRVVDLNDIIEEMTSMLGRVIEEHITLSCELASEICQVEVDPGQMERVVMNLALNARDALTAGGRITITTEKITLGADRAPGELPDVPDGDYVVLTLTDDGVGMDEETRQQIFEPFFTTKHRTQGTGLGLAMAYGIVRQSKGWIHCTSALEEGTRFSIHLPVALSPPKQEQEPKHAPAPDLDQKVMLLAEDEQPVRRLLQRILESAGCQVHAAEDGEQALALFHTMQDRVDLLITDVVMPGLSGPALAERVLRERPGLKVLFLSGYAADNLPAERRPDPNRPLLQKPVSREELLRAVRELVA